MAGRRIVRTIVLTTFILAGTSLWVEQATAAWKPARPEGDLPRVRLVPETETKQSEQRPRSTYVMVPPGESAVFVVSGQGRMRIRTQPAYTPADKSGVFRLRVCFDDTTCRRFKRRSQPAEVVTVIPLRSSQPTVAAKTITLRPQVGKEDVLEIEVPAGTRRITIENPGRDPKPLFLRVLLQGDLVQKPIAATRDQSGQDHHLSVQLDAAQLGYDSNAYLAPADDNDNTGKLFWPAGAEVEYRDRSWRAMELGARYAFKGRLFQESLLNEYRHRLEARQEWAPASKSRAGGWTLELEEGLTYKQSTFFGRGDEAELETITSQGDTLSLADRFNSLTLNLTPSAAWRISEDIEATASFTWRLRNYVEDYAAYADIYSLDQDSKEFELGLEWEAMPNLNISGTLNRADKQYDQKYSRDADGMEIEAVAANYVKTSGTVGIKWGARVGLRLGGELKVYQNSDQYEGYWDYSGTALEATGGWRWQKGHRVDLKVRRSETDHDRSRVENDPSFPLRSKTVLNVRASAQYRLSPRFEWVGRLHYKDYDYNSRLFAYTRTLVQAGVRFEF
jgi:hypothetical protein